MKVTLFFKIIGIILLFGSALIFTGCDRDEPTPKPKIKLKYIKRKCPNITTLKPIPNRYQTEEVRLTIKPYPENKEFYLVNKKELKQASTNSQKKSILIRKQEKYIDFYEKQNRVLKKACK